MDSGVIREAKPQSYLLVEGSEDKHVFHHLLGSYKVNIDDKCIKDCGGKDELLRALKVHLKVDEQKRLAVVLDADDDLSRCWQQVKGILEQSGYLSVPREPMPEGTILEEDGRPIVGIWLMPDNRLPGKIEDFVSYLIQADDPLWPIAGDILQQVIEVDCRFRAAYTIKARLHIWLAWQKIPGKPMGLAITARYVDAGDLHAQQLINWVRRVFDLAIK